MERKGLCDESENKNKNVTLKQYKKKKKKIKKVKLKKKKKKKKRLRERNYIKLTWTINVAELKDERIPQHRIKFRRMILELTFLVAFKTSFMDKVL